MSPIGHACKKKNMGVCVCCGILVSELVWGCEFGCLFRRPSLSFVCVSVSVCVYVGPYVDVCRKKSLGECVFLV